MNFLWIFFNNISFMESCSTHKGCVFLLIGFEWFFLFCYPLKLILKFFGGHFEFFGSHFEFFLHIPDLLTKLWKQSGFGFLIYIFFYPLKLILNFFGGHFEFFWGPFWIFFGGILIYSQSCGNKVVFVFWSDPSKYSKSLCRWWCVNQL